MLKFILLTACLSGCYTGNAKILALKTGNFLSSKSKECFFSVKFIGSNDNSADVIRLDMHDEFNLTGIGPSVISSLYGNEKDGEWKFTLPDVEGPTYISLSRIAKTNDLNDSIAEFLILSEYVICPGDSIELILYSDRLEFKGRGGVRMQKWYELMRSQSQLQHKKAVVSDADAYEQYFSNQDAILSNGLLQLGEWSLVLDPESIKILKAEFIGRNRIALYRSFLIPNFHLTTAGYGNRMLEYYGRKYVNAIEEVESLWVLSPAYTCYLYYKTILDERYKLIIAEKIATTNGSGSDLFIRVVDYKYSGVLKDKLLVHWIQLELEKNNIPDNQFTQLSYSIADEKYKSLVDRIRLTFGTGYMVDNFVFENNTGRKVSLNDFKGYVVFIDLWFTECTACRAVAKAIPKVEQSFLRDSVVFLSISIDANKEKWLHSIDKKKKPDKKYPLSGSHYTGDNTVYLYTSGRGSNSNFIQRYNKMNAYPRLLLIGKDGKMASSGPPRPDMPEGQQKLIALIKETLSK